MSFFGSRDLALLLPDQVGDAYSLRHSSQTEEVDEYQELKPKIDPTKKVSRYFPGQTPSWIKEDELGAGSKVENQDSSAATASRTNLVSSDPRLARLARMSTAKDTNAPSSERGRRRIEAQVIVDAEEPQDEKTTPSYVQNQRTSDSDDDEDEDDIQARRERVLAKRSQVQESESSDDDDDDVSEKASRESEFETDTDESIEEEPERLRPVFVPKHLRTTIKDQAMIEAEEELKLKKKKEIDMNRKQQTRSMLAESLKRTEDAKALDETDADSDAGLPDVTDDPNDPIEFENWRIRELTRLKRDALAREQSEKEKKELERRRAMTEEERLAEDKKLGIGIFKEKEKEKWKFMQRYYHKGVFYMDEDSTKPQAVDPSSGDVKVDVRKRDYSAPTLEDRYDKEQLPSVLQVKKFGMRGRTKYTHLVDQDTTDFKNPLKPNQKVLEKYLSKRSGVGDIDSATRGNKRPKI